MFNSARKLTSELKLTLLGKLFVQYTYWKTSVALQQNAACEN